MVVILATHVARACYISTQTSRSMHAILHLGRIVEGGGQIFLPELLPSTSQPCLRFGTPAQGTVAHQPHSRNTSLCGISRTLVPPPGNEAGCKRRP